MFNEAEDSQNSQGADARILELEKLVDKLYGRIFILEVTRENLVDRLTANAIHSLVVRVEGVQNKLDAANARLKDLGAAVIE